MSTNHASTYRANRLHLAICQMSNGCSHHFFLRGDVKAHPTKQTWHTCAAKEGAPLQDLHYYIALQLFDDHGEEAKKHDYTVERLALLSKKDAVMYTRLLWDEAKSRKVAKLTAEVDPIFWRRLNQFFNAGIPVPDVATRIQELEQVPLAHISAAQDHELTYLHRFI